MLQSMGSQRAGHAWTNNNMPFEVSEVLVLEKRKPSGKKVQDIFFKGKNQQDKGLGLRKQVWQPEIKRNR